MRKKGLLCLLISFILLSLSSAAFAKQTQKIIPGLGILTIPSGIELVKSPEKEPGYNLLVNDNGIWRTAKLFFTSAVPDVKRSDLKENIEILDMLLSEAAVKLQNTPNARLLENSPVNQAAFANEQLVIKYTKVYNDMRALRADSYILDGADKRLRLLVVFYDDGNSDYWKQTIPKIIAGIQH